MKNYHTEIRRQNHNQRKQLESYKQIPAELKRRAFYHMAKKAVPVILGAVSAASLWYYRENKTIQLTKKKIKSKRISQAFSGFRIVQISDLHDAEFGRNNHRLLKLIRKQNPDIIVITGDIIYGRKIRHDIELRFLEEAVKLAPVYFVMGNHEAGQYLEYKRLETWMHSLGVHVLRNQEEFIEREGEKIRIVGIDDPKLYVSEKHQFPAMIQIELDRFRNPEYDVESDAAEDCPYTILLSHRPEVFRQYVDAHMDLVLSGHAHGGQIRLPLIGGLFAPSQGFLPKYTAGKFERKGTIMYVSRGLGRSLFPTRIHNRPELVVLELKKIKK